MKSFFKHKGIYSFLMALVLFFVTFFSAPVVRLDAATINPDEQINRSEGETVDPVPEETTDDPVDEEPVEETDPLEEIPELVSAKAKTNKITIKFRGVTGAEGYAIYRWTDDDDMEIIDELDEDAKSYTDTGLKQLKTYYYSVAAIVYDDEGDAVYGEMDEEGIEATTGFKNIKVLSVEPVRISQKVTWKKNSSAQGYIVYRKAEDAAKYTKLKKIKGAATTSFLDKKVNLGDTFTYKVVAYGEADDGSSKKSGSNEVTGTVELKIKKKKVKDQNSSVYNKTLRLYYFGDGTRIEDPEKYLSDDEKGTYEIYVNKAKGQTVVYSKVGKELIPLKSFICSPGYATPIGTHHTIVKLRWHELMGPCWGQWCTRVVSNGIYFHSIFYNSYNNNKNLAVGAYNRLGTVCSHGCIRLQAYAAKWIFDNCAIGTTVHVVSKTGYEPLARPKVAALPYWHTWDPTDPGAVKYCKEHHCHGQ